VHVLRCTIDELRERFAQSAAASGAQHGDTSNSISIITLNERQLTLSAHVDVSGLRPGGVVSGPTIMAIVDSAGWLLTIAHNGTEYDAVTTDLSVQFLRPCQPGELKVTATALRIGRRCIIGVGLGGSEQETAVNSVITFAPVKRI